MQSLQTQRNLTTARDLQCFKQRRDARGINKGNLGQVYDDDFRWLSLQDGLKPIAEIWRRIDAYVAMQSQECAFFAVIHGDVKTVVSGH